jgi:hypothetical protein
MRETGLVMLNQTASVPGRATVNSTPTTASEGFETVKLRFADWVSVPKSIRFVETVRGGTDMLTVITLDPPLEVTGISAV